MPTKNKKSYQIKTSQKFKTISVTQSRIISMMRFLRISVKKTCWILVRTIQVRWGMRVMRRCSRKKSTLSEALKTSLSSVYHQKSQINPFSKKKKKNSTRKNRKTWASKALFPANAKPYSTRWHLASAASPSTTSRKESHQISHQRLSWLNYHRQLSRKSRRNKKLSRKNQRKKSLQAKTSTHISAKATTEWNRMTNTSECPACPSRQSWSKTTPISCAMLSQISCSSSAKRTTLSSRTGTSGSKLNT